MSRWMKLRGHMIERFLFDEPLPSDPTVYRTAYCPRCGGAGVVSESIDDERADVAVPCPHCRMFCKACRDWVKRAGHNCEEKDYGHR